MSGGVEDKLGEYGIPARQVSCVERALWTRACSSIWRLVDLSDEWRRLGSCGATSEASREKEEEDWADKRGRTDHVV